ncbi:MAG: MotE family protein [Myxococcota bacterium]
MSTKSWPSRLVSVVPGSLLLFAAVLGSPAQGQEAPTTESALAQIPRGSSMATDGFRRLARQVEARSRSLDRRERNMTSRVEDLERAEQDLAARVVELTAAREALEALLEKTDQLEEDRLAGLVKMTEKMRDKQAAALFVELDAKLAVKVIDRMNRTKAGRALAVMEPAKAARLAEKLTRPIEMPR